MDDISNVDKSDSMICSSISYNAFNSKKNNDLMFYKQMDMPQNTTLIDRCIENNLMKAPSVRECEVSDRIKKRGGNNDLCEPEHFCKGFECYTNYHLSEFFLTPCPINTWRNHIISNEDMGCSKRHQFFMTITKRV